MKYKIEYCYENHSKITSSLKGIGLDSPMSSCVIEDKVGLLEFSGWILTHKENDIVNIIFTDNKKSQSVFPRNYSRPDVIEALELQPSYASILKLGFKYNFNVKEVVEIGIELNGELINIWKISEKTQRYLDSGDQAIIAWQAIHTSDISLLCQRNITLETLEIEGFWRAFEVISPHDFIKQEKISEIHSKRFLELTNSLQDPKWPIHAFEKINNSGLLQIPGIKHSKPLNCKFSVAVHYINFVFFENEFESAYLVQYCKNVLLILPGQFTAISFYGISDWSLLPLSKTGILLKYLLDHKEFIIKNKDREKGCFLGFNLSQPRPYHFYYDYLYGLFKFTKHFQNIEFDSYSIGGCDFFDSALLDGVKRQFYTSDQSLNKNTIKNAKYLLSPSIEAARLSFEHFEPYTESLLQIATEKHNDKDEIKTRKGDVLTIWIGISSEKRSWVQQIEGFKKILERLLINFSSIKILVDGRTFPLNPSAEDILQKGKEEEALSKLVFENSGVEFISLIGMRSIEKIYMANKADFFISSYGTDSMYPSAICRKPGVVYAAPSIGEQKSLHKHDKIIEVPASSIKEIHDSDSVKAWHETSISMDWKDVYDCVIELMNKYGIHK